MCIKKLVIPNLLGNTSQIEIGKHLHWEVFGLNLNGETMIMSWIVIIIIIVFYLVAVKNPKYIPNKIQNLIEYTYEKLEDISKNQIGEQEYERWAPYISTLFLFTFVSNWSGILLPLKIIPLQKSGLGSPTNDINTTTALALLTSISYMYGGIRKKGLGYWQEYFNPNPALFPIKILEDFTKPLSLSFRLFGNILADELLISVFCLLAPIIIPLPIMSLALFASSIQALIFSTLSAAYIGEATKEHKIK